MRSLLTILVLCFALASTPVFAVDDARGAFMVAQSGGKSLNEAVEQVRRQCNGRIVDAKTRVKGNREVHQIKCLTKDGKVKTYNINGKRRGNG